jgi:hypothetical protein
MSAPPPQNAGLCALCAHAREVRTPRSAYWLCGLSRDDPRFERYPRLPVLQCPGFAPLAGAAPPGRGVPPGGSPGPAPRE